MGQSDNYYIGGQEYTSDQVDKEIQDFMIKNNISDYSLGMERWERSVVAEYNYVQDENENEKKYDAKENSVSQLQIDNDTLFVQSIDNYIEKNPGMNYSEAYSVMAKKLNDLNNDYTALHRYTTSSELEKEIEKEANINDKFIPGSALEIARKHSDWKNILSLIVKTNPGVDREKAENIALKLLEGQCSSNVLSLVELLQKQKYIITKFL